MFALDNRRFKYLWIITSLLGGFAASLHAGQLHLSPIVIGLVSTAFLLLTSEGLYRILRKIQYSEFEQFRVLDAIAMAPLCLPFLLWTIEPIIQSVGSTISFSIAGYIHFPWMAQGVKLTTGNYFLLLGFGAGWVVSGFLRLLFWLRALYQVFQKSEPKYAGILLFSTALLAGLWLQGWASAVYPPTGDEVHYLLMSKSFTADGDFDLKNNFAQKDWLADYPGEELSLHGHPDKAGRWICNHMPAISVVVSPLYALLGSWGASVMTLLLVTLAVWMLYGFACDLGAQPKWAFLTYAISLVTAPFSIWGYLIYPVAAGMLLVMIGLRLMTRLESTGVVFLLGIISCTLPWFHQGLGIIGLAFLFALGMKLLLAKRYKDLAVMAGGGFITGLPFIWILLTYYQTAHITGDYAFSFRFEFFTYAVIGQLVDRNYGILTAAPILLVAFVGLGFISQQRHKWLIWLIIALPIVSGLQAALFVDWNGFSASFSRFLTPACTPLFVGLAFVFPWQKAMRKFVVLLTAYGALVSLSTWIMPALLYEIPKANILTKLAAYKIPPLWKFFPLLKGEAQWLAVGWGMILIGAAVYLVCYLRKIKHSRKV